MNRQDDPEHVYGLAWDWILEAAESVLEDDTNERDVPQELFDEVIAAAFEIFTNPGTMMRFL